MATIYNSNLTKEITDVGKLQVSRDVVPTQLAEKVVPVIDVNPKHARIANIVRRATCLNSTATTIYTTPADKDFYLTAVNCYFIKDAGATSANTYVTVVVDGVTQSIIDLPQISGTAQSGGLSYDLSVPIKIDRNTTIVLNNQTNNAVISAKSTIVGFTVDNINA